MIEEWFIQNRFFQPEAHLAIWGGDSPYHFEDEELGGTTPPRAQDLHRIHP